MDELNALYIQMLHVGMLVLRQALSEGDKDWADAEVELLHNVPSLINEPDACQHRYFWEATRAHHIEWATQPGHELAKSRMMTYYEPLWNQMEAVLKEPVSLGKVCDHGIIAASSQSNRDSAGQEAGKSDAVLRIAIDLFHLGPDWLTFFREVLGLEGVIRKAFSTPAELFEFERSPQYSEIQRMLAVLRGRRGVEPKHKEPTTVSTFRSPK